ncbi:LON peptidase substrate-binding domain-containing protein [Flagellatimonas centrodinii]|uniref:LON peptidase substrate-binding domain-containing protein n=1 Tax=Flagellatimonas centrodinii TaxID=2806210 RepID=UPI001FF90B8A|nr:LON peptidase substrate-binding domain-containing protein [Flagellatimonas centrodinii]ULQ47524.1 LON peptidase substrate-binding domain-containing protein [Flagellatimonas centrodinii]
MDDDTLEIPIFPLGSVLFPAGVMTLRIFEQRYVDMTKACIRDESPFGIALIRAGFEVGQPAIPCDIGCTARILEWEVPSPGLFNLQVRGETRFRILSRWAEPDGLIRARVSLLEASAPQAVPPRHAPLAKLLTRLMSELGPAYFPMPGRTDDAAWVGFRLAELLPVPPERKQALLTQSDPLVVLDAVEQLLIDLRAPD